MPSIFTARQKTFCVEYAKTGNGTQSAIKAGFSEKAATTQATRLLGYAHVKEELNKLEQRFQDEQKISRERIAEELRTIAFSDLLDYTTNGILDLGALPPGASRAIGKIVQRKTGDTIVTTFTLHDKTKALDQLAKLLGLNAAEVQEHRHLHVHMDHNERARRVLGILARGAGQTLIDQGDKPKS